MLATVTEDQFEFIGDTKVRHTPTGSEFSTYRYDDAADVRITWERMGDEKTFDLESLRAMALSLLRARAQSTGVRARV